MEIGLHDDILTSVFDDESENHDLPQQDASKSCGDSHLKPHITATRMNLKLMIGSISSCQNPKIIYLCYLI